MFVPKVRPNWGSVMQRQGNTTCLVCGSWLAVYPPLSIPAVMRAYVAGQVRAHEAFECREYSSDYPHVPAYGSCCSITRQCLCD